VAAFGELTQGLSAAEVVERINRHFGVQRPVLLPVEDFPADIPLAHDHGSPIDAHPPERVN
jgi:hypothetical protein